MGEREYMEKLAAKLAPEALEELRSLFPTGVGNGLPGHRWRSPAAAKKFQGNFIGQALRGSMPPDTFSEGTAKALGDYTQHYEGVLAHGK